MRLEEKYEVDIITQNIDDLHERAGSKRVMHLHGEFFKMCSSKDKSVSYPCHKNIELGDKAPDGNQLRPFIVWFGESVPMMDMAEQLCKMADILIIVGTSLQVYPAAGLVHAVPKHTPIYLIDKNPPTLSTPELSVYNENASTGIKKVVDLLLND